MRVHGVSRGYSNAVHCHAFEPRIASEQLHSQIEYCELRLSHIFQRTSSTARTDIWPPDPCMHVFHLLSSVSNFVMIRRSFLGRNVTSIKARSDCNFSTDWHGECTHQCRLHTIDGKHRTLVAIAFSAAL